MKNLKSQLAINGGKATVVNELVPDSTLGEDERLALDRVLGSGSLSGFYGNWGEEFLG